MPVRAAASEVHIQIHTPTALLRPWHVPSGFIMAMEMQFPCKMRPILKISWAFHTDFSSQRRGYSSLCFSQLRWLWRREISRDERREKLRIPFGIGRMKKSKKYPNGGKFKQSLTNSMTMKNPFSHNIWVDKAKSFQIVVFPFLRHIW